MVWELNRSAVRLFMLNSSILMLPDSGFFPVFYPSSGSKRRQRMYFDMALRSARVPAIRPEM